MFMPGRDYRDSLGAHRPGAPLTQPLPMASVARRKPKTAAEKRGRK